MPREIDERWIDQAIERYDKAESLMSEFRRAVHGLEVTVRSADRRVELQVDGRGAITDVLIDDDALVGLSAKELGQSVLSACQAAADAATWARRKAYEQTFADYRPLAEDSWD